MSLCESGAGRDVEVSLSYPESFPRTMSFSFESFTNDLDCFPRAFDRIGLMGGEREFVPPPSESESDDILLKAVLELEEERGDPFE